MRVYANVPLATRTSLRVGGPAARVVEVDREEALPDLVRDAADADEALVVLGDGTNVVAGDGGWPGMVLQVGVRGVDVRRDGDRVRVDVGAGETWDTFVERAVDEGWCGVESLSGIPGRVGATPIQNVGAYGWDVGETIESVRVFDREEKTFADVSGKACQFGYRASLFKATDRYIVTRVAFTLDVRATCTVRYAELARALSIPPGAQGPLAEVRTTVISLRRAKGMVLDPSDPDTVSAGSFFVNPIVDASTLARVAARAGEAPPSFAAGGGLHKVAAAWLVERAGFRRGWRKGQVGVSRKHSLALVNLGGATASELLAVARHVRDGVRTRFAIELEPEPVFLGCSWSAP
jgi:UDP-N-acetylmuramate dehydrogenase